MLDESFHIAREAVSSYVPRTEKDVIETPTRVALENAPAKTDRHSF